MHLILTLNGVVRSLSAFFHRILFTGPLLDGESQRFSGAPAIELPIALNLGPAFYPGLKQTGAYAFCLQTQQGWQLGESRRPRGRR
jgi:hypothetical protein